MVGTYQFSRGNYSVNEGKPGYVEITVTRSNSFTAGVVVIKMQDGTARTGRSPRRRHEKLRGEHGGAGVRRGRDNQEVPDSDLQSRDGILRLPLLYLDVERRHRPALRQRRGLYCREASPTVTDDDTIYGGSDWDIILGDSGNIPGYAVVAEYIDINKHEKLGDIKTYGGPATTPSMPTSARTTLTVNSATTS